jgi:hypothetical protein
MKAKFARLTRSQIALVSLFIAATSAGCRDQAATRAVGAAKPIAAEPPVPPGSPPELGRMSIFERLAREAQTRPVVAPRPEAVAAALSAQGLPLERWKQVLASPIGARFCMSGQTAAGSVVAVCEFGDTAEADAGLAYSHKTFDGLIPNRSLVRRNQTVLTVTRPAGVANREGEKVQQIFAAL